MIGTPEGATSSDNVAHAPENGDSQLGSVAELIRSACREGARRGVRVVTDARRGHIFFERGHVVHAEFGENVGLGAVIDMLQAGTVELRPCARPWPSHPSLFLPPDMLLMTPVPPNPRPSSPATLVRRKAPAAVAPEGAAPLQARALSEPQGPSTAGLAGPPRSQGSARAKAALGAPPGGTMKGANAPAAASPSKTEHLSEPHAEPEGTQHSSTDPAPPPQDAVELPWPDALQTLAREPSAAPSSGGSAPVSELSRAVATAVHRWGRRQQAAAAPPASGDPLLGDERERRPNPAASAATPPPSTRISRARAEAPPSTASPSTASPSTASPSTASPSTLAPRPQAAAPRGAATPSAPASAAPAAAAPQGSAPSAPASRTKAAAAPRGSAPSAPGLRNATVPPPGSRPSAAAPAPPASRPTAPGAGRPASDPAPEQREAAAPRVRAGKAVWVRRAPRRVAAVAVPPRPLRSVLPGQPPSPTTMVRVSPRGVILAARGEASEQLANAAAFIHNQARLIAADLGRHGRTVVHLRGGGLSLLVLKSETHDIAAALGPTARLRSLLRKVGFA